MLAVISIAFETSTTDTRFRRPVLQNEVNADRKRFSESPWMRLSAGLDR